MPKKPRNFKKEYRDYHSSSEQKKRRAQRNKARRKAVRKHGKAAMRGKEVHHVGNNRKGKLGNKTRIVSKKTNRKKQPKRNGKQD